MLSKKTLRELAEKKAYTEREKNVIVKQAFAYGITINENCPDCYRDAVITCLAKLEEKELIKNIDKNGRTLFLRPSLDVYMFGMRINAETITSDDEIRQLLELGMPERWVLTAEQLKAYANN